MYRCEIWDVWTRKMTFEFDDFEGLSCYSHTKRFLAIHRSVFSPHRLMIWIIHWLDISNEHSKRKSTCKRCKRTKTIANQADQFTFTCISVGVKYRQSTVNIQLIYVYICICFIMYNNKNTRFKKIIGPTLKINSKHWHLNNEKRSSDFLQMSPLVFPTRKTWNGMRMNIQVLSFQVNISFNSAQIVAFNFQLFNIYMHSFKCGSHHAITQNPTNFIYTHYLEDSPKVLFVLYLR